MTDSGNTPPPPPGDTPPPGETPPPSNGGSTPPPLGGGGGDDAGFIASLFDYTFTHFITPKIIRVLYILLTIAVAIGYIFFVIASFNTDGTWGVIALLIVGPIVALIYLAFIRVTLEFYLAVVRMSEDIHKRSGRI